MSVLRIPCLWEPLFERKKGCYKTFERGNSPRRRQRHAAAAWRLPLRTFFLDRRKLCDSPFAAGD